jgi:hypothetical protein
MILFRAVEAPPSEGRLVYRPDEYSFDFLPLPVGGRSIGIGDLQLGVDESGRVVSVWGLCPYPSWKAARLTGPPRIRAGLVADGIDRLRLGESMPLEAVLRWPVSHDSSSGWVCVGAPDQALYDRCVEFATGCVAALAEDNLVALWLHPEHEPESTDDRRPAARNGRAGWAIGTHPGGGVMLGRGSVGFTSGRRQAWAAELFAFQRWTSRCGSPSMDPG